MQGVVDALVGPAGGYRDDATVDLPDRARVLLAHVGGGIAILAVSGIVYHQLTGTVLVPRHTFFQAPRPTPWKKVWRDVLLGLPGKPERGVAERVLAEVGLTHCAGAWPRTLSGNEAQRATLARAPVREPDLLLLDEPFGTLNAPTRAEARRLLGELWQRRGCAVILVTHDVAEAVLLADRVLVMDEGATAYETTVEPDRPRDITDPLLAELRTELLARLGSARSGVHHDPAPSVLRRHGCPQHHPDRRLLHRLRARARKGRLVRHP
ncbi:ATP-binding cassette domain-containing protein [Streptomyces sp. NPDC002701]|uniref:ATP-binding cassette domain-containing protein n=1 Tax=Streptomyces sp. NPDC002701 TaxID=3364661 RepID=UPI0036943C37